MAISTSIKRRVVFYQLLRDGKPIKSTADFDFSGAFAKIKKMPNTISGRRVFESDDSAITCFVDGPKTVQFGRLGFRNLPARVEGEIIDDVRLTAAGGLFEAIDLRLASNAAPTIAGERGTRPPQPSKPKIRDSINSPTMRSTMRWDLEARQSVGFSGVTSPSGFKPATTPTLSRCDAR